MTTLEIKSIMPLTDLLDSLKQLGSDELGEVATTAVRLRANRRASMVPEPEAILLGQINKTLMPDEQQHIDELIEKRQAGTLTKVELTELMTLSDLIEEIQVERLSAMIELAAIRGVSLETLKKSIGFSPTI